MPSNSDLYITTESCATFGLSVGCTVIAANGWYYDNNTGYSYLISNNSVSQIDTSPCVTPAPTVTPAPYTWTAVELAFGSTGASGTACSNAVDGLTGTFYMSGLTFSTSDYIRLNSDGTGLPDNRTYSNGSIYRAVTNGSVGVGGNCRAN
jgi:hypothetical protein